MFLTDDFRFNGQHAFPGRLDSPYTLTTDESDWGWTGLRDIGDMSRYPYIDTYANAEDSKYNIPAYTQRSSFVAAFSDNIVAALLHYIRLHRTEENYHYQNPQAVTALSDFLEACLDHYLLGLFGEPAVKAEQFFSRETGDHRIYHQWLQQTAQEVLYWTAPQSESDWEPSDCFAAHLKRQGCPSTELYPHETADFQFRYRDKYFTSGREFLGPRADKLPLSSLIRGLYLMSVNIAEQLQPVQH